MSAARTEFVDYASKRLIRLSEFYESIAEEFSSIDAMEDFVAASASAYYCPRCGDRNDQPKKFFVIDAGVCQRISLTNTEALNGDERLSSQHIIAKVKRGLSDPYFETYQSWYLYFSPDEQTELAPSSFVFLPPFTYTYIKVQAKKYVTLRSKSKGADCVSKNDDPLYSRLRCVVKCNNEIFVNHFGCQEWWRLDEDFENFLDYSRYCNVHDAYQNQSMQKYLYVDDEVDILRNLSVPCFAKCPHKCERMFYDLSIISQIDMKHADYDHIVDTLSTQNVSAIHLNVVHNSIFEGGIMTYTELNTFTYVEFANNIGGTLGLFVGGTLLTLVQVLVFCVTVIFEKVRSLLQRNAAVEDMYSL